MRRVWLNSFLLILVWPGSCGNAEASSVGPSCTATSATAAPCAARRLYRSPARGQRPHRRRRRRHHGARRGSTPFASAAGLSTSLPPARARPEHRKTTRGETYMLQTTKEHCCLSTQPRPRAASVWLPFACFQSIVCSARHLTASCTILLQNLHSREQSLVQEDLGFRHSLCRKQSFHTGRFSNSQIESLNGTFSII